MRVLHISAHSGGGAGTAAIRLSDGLSKFGVESDFYAFDSVGDNSKGWRPLSNWQLLRVKTMRRLSARIISLQRSPSNRVLHSMGLFSSGLGEVINSSDYDLVNMHWVCSGMLSLKEISRIQKPIVWTMHDMWSFTGAEHYDDTLWPGRWRYKYDPSNRPPNHWGLDIDKFVWARKRALWKNKGLALVAPSNWIADCARESALMGNQDVFVIPNPIDVAAFKPIEKGIARKKLNLPSNKKLILFGALGATSDPRKGYDLLLESLRSIESRCASDASIELVVLGGKKREISRISNLKAHNLGTIKDEETIRAVFSASDLFVAPSRQDNLPNMVVEAGACGLQSLAFDVGGLSDIIEPGTTGSLIPAFDTDEMGREILRLLSFPIAGGRVRNATKRKFDASVVLPNYLNLYESIIENG